MDMSGSSDMTSAEILERATGLLNHPTAETAGLWPRATAVLARQALEVGLHEALSEKILGIQTLRFGCSCSVSSPTSRTPRPRTR